MLPNSKLCSFMSWIGLCLCMVTGNIWGQGLSDLEAEENKLHVQWQDQFWSYLETSEHAQFRTASGIRLLRIKDPVANERGLELIDEAVSTLNPDPASLWLVASECQFRKVANWCEPGGVYEMLIQADPDNVAVLMLRFSQASLAKDEELLDTEANRQLLLRAAEANRFDMYWGRGADKLYGEALKFVEIHPVPPIPELEQLKLQLVFSPHTYAFFATMGLIVTNTSVGYNNTAELCRIQARNQRAKAIEACKKLAQILRNYGYSLMTRTVGFGIEKAMLRDIDPDDPRIRSWQLRGQVSSIMQICFSPRWLNNTELWPETSVETMMNWAKNLSELGEVQGNRLTAMQEYNTSPDDFVVTPADCDKLLDLDDEGMARLVDGQDPYAAWQTMQAEAGGHE